MALSRCLNCNRDISTEAAACPHCGIEGPLDEVSKKIAIELVQQRLLKASNNSEPMMWIDQAYGECRDCKSNIRVTGLEWRRDPQPTAKGIIELFHLELAHTSHIYEKACPNCGYKRPPLPLYCNAESECKRRVISIAFFKGKWIAACEIHKYEWCTGCLIWDLSSEIEPPPLTRWGNSRTHRNKRICSWVNLWDSQLKAQEEARTAQEEARAAREKAHTAQIRSERIAAQLCVDCGKELSWWERIKIKTVCTICSKKAAR